MIPNIVFAIKCKNGFENKWHNKLVEILEQIGRFSCFGFMIINIPKTTYGFFNKEIFISYLVVDALLVFIYVLIWIIYFQKNSIFRALALSIIPSTMFIFSGITMRSILLTVAAIIFAPTHILISYRNAKM